MTAKILQFTQSYKDTGYMPVYFINGYWCMYLPKMIGPKKQSKQVDRSRFELDEYMCDLYAGYVAADNDHSPTNKLGLYPCATTERK